MRRRLFVLALCAVLAGACASQQRVPEVAAPSAQVLSTFSAAAPSSTAAPVPTPAPTSPPAPTFPSTPAPTPTPQLEDPLAASADGGFTVPDDPVDLAALITAAEYSIRDLDVPPESLADAGHRQQAAYRQLGHNPELIPAVLAELPPQLRPSAEANIFAGARLFAMHSPDPDGPVEIRDLPNWRIVEPPPAEELLGHYRHAEAETGVHWTYLAAVHLVETRMGRIQGTSVAGAQGPMQFMPATWAEWGEGDVHDPGDAILAAGRYLRWGGMPGDVDGALHRYNRDDRYVDAVRTYAEQMQADPRTFHGYYHWQVYYFTGAENVWLPHGYDGSR